MAGGIRLGSEFEKNLLEPLPAQPDPLQLAVGTALLQVVGGLEQLTQAIALLQARPDPTLPPIEIPPTDFTSLVEALEKRQPPLHEPIAYPSPDEAIAGKIPDNTAAVAKVLAEMSEQLKRLNKKLSAVASIGGGSGSTVELARVVDLLVAQIPESTLTSRMKAGQPTLNYRIWSDLANTSHWYIAEGPKDSDGTGGTHRGVRISLDADGKPVGEWQENIGFIWNDRAPGQAGWS